VVSGFCELPLPGIVSESVSVVRKNANFRIARYLLANVE
jgi:hypothetical protein